MIPHNIAYYVNQKYNVKHRVKSYKIVNGKKRVIYYYKKKHNKKYVYYTNHKKRLYRSKYVWKTKKQAYYKKRKYIKDYKKLKTNLYNKSRDAYNLYIKEKRDAVKNYKAKIWQLSLKYKKTHMIDYLAWKKKWSGKESKTLKSLNNSWILYLKKNISSYNKDIKTLKTNANKIILNLKLNYRKNQNAILKGWKSGRKKNRYNHNRIIKRERKKFYLNRKKRNLALKNKLASINFKYNKERKQKALEYKQKNLEINAKLKSSTTDNRNKYIKELNEYNARYRKSLARDAASFKKQRNAVTKYYRSLIKKSRYLLSKKIALEKAKWAARLKIRQRAYSLKRKLANKRKMDANRLWYKTMKTLKSRHWKKYNKIIKKREAEMAKWQKKKALKHKKLMNKKKKQYLIALKTWKLAHKKLQAENRKKYNKARKNWVRTLKYTLLKNRTAFLSAKKRWLKSWTKSKKQFRKIYLANKKRYITKLLKKKGELAAKYILSKRKHNAEWKKYSIKSTKNYHKRRKQNLSSYLAKKKYLKAKYTKNSKYFIKKQRKLLKYYEKIYKKGIKIDTQKVLKQIGLITKNAKKLYKDLKTKYSLKGIKPTITTYKTTTNSKTTYSIKRTCSKKIYAYLKSEKKYRCVSYNKKYIVSSCKMTDGDTGKCTEEIQLKGTRVCSKWYNMSGTIKCVRHVTVWPKYKCDESKTINKKSVCTKKTYFNPRFYCKEYKIWNGKRICKKRSVYYGKNQYIFKCVKKGEIIQKKTKILLGATQETSVSGCLKYKKKLKSKYRNLKLINLKTSITWWKNWIKKSKKSKKLGKSYDSSYIGCYRDRKSRDLYKYLGRGYTPETCKTKCGALKFKYASVQYFGECYCDNNYGKYGIAKNCNLRCRKDKTKICGGAWANSVYKTSIIVTQTPHLLGKTLKSECTINEKTNSRGAHRCYKSSECQGKRYCSAWGWCHGSSKCQVAKKVVKKATKKLIGCSINERKNKRGPHRCYESTECTGKRYCSKWGWCHGKSFCGRKLRSYRFKNLPKSFKRNLKALLPKLNKKDKKILGKCF